MSRAGETLVLQGSDGARHQLNPTAYALWVLCDGVTSPEEMAAAVRELFDVGGDVATRDVERGLGELADAGLIRTRRSRP